MLLSNLSDEIKSQFSGICLQLRHSKMVLTIVIYFYM